MYKRIMLTIVVDPVLGFDTKKIQHMITNGLSNMPMLGGEITDKDGLAVIGQIASIKAETIVAEKNKL